MATHEMFDGRLQVYRRENSSYWQCAARVNGRRFRSSTKQENLDRAKDVAEEWYLDLRGKTRRGEIVKPERTFGEAAELYLRAARVLAQSVRSPKYIEFMELRMRRHILPFFGEKAISSINRAMIMDYRVQRAEETMAKTATPDGPGKPPARSTMSQEIVHIRQVLKHAEGLGWIKHVPNLSTPYMTQGKKGRRAWFSPEEYKQLYTATRRRITEGRRPGYKSHYEDMHDFVLFMANTGLRPDEAANLEMRDVTIEDDDATRETILVLDIRGKTGVRYSKSMPGAVEPFRRLRERRRGELVESGLEGEEFEMHFNTTKVFRKFNRSLFNQILREERLKEDRDGQRRTAYSLRHTYISLRLMSGANVVMVANNCGTSIQMIEEHYAAHIKERLDTTAINITKPKPRAKKPRG